jgi:hypothetical protein
MARSLRVLGAVVLTLVMLTGAHAINRPQPADVTDPFIRTGRVGEDFRARTFTVRVLGVRGGAYLRGANGQQIDTGGVFVLVKIRVLAHDEPVLIQGAQVRDAAGNQFDASKRAPDRLGGKFPPGIPVDLEVTFEVPTASASSLTLRISENSTYVQFADVVEIPLNVTPADVAQWREAKDWIDPAAMEIAR